MEKIVVTGATGGLGKVVVEHLLNNQYKVIAIIRKQEDAARLEPLTDNAALSWAVAELTDSTAVERIAKEHHDTFGIVHLAGGFAAAEKLGSTSTDDYMRMLRMNVDTTFTVLQQFMPVLLRNQRGSIVTIGARAAVEPNGSNAAYAAAKAALLQLTRNAAKEGIGHGVRANAIIPGIIRTEANMEWGSAAQMEKWTSPASIAAVIRFLLSENGAGINDTFIKMYGDLAD